TPIDTDSKVGPEGVAVQDPTLYRSLAGGLQYLTFTRPDLSYAVQQICLYMHDPREPHFAALKRILRPSYNSTAGPTAFYTGPVHYSSQPHPLVHQPAQQAQFLQPQSAHHPGILGPPPSQETTLPSAFSTMTLQDPTW
nr:ribonuclease H-like domain-containing protein [Tanacetum cinerariifolium]